MLTGCNNPIFVLVLVFFVLFWWWWGGGLFGLRVTSLI